MSGASQDLAPGEDYESEKDSAREQEKETEKRPRRIIKPTIKVLETGNKALNAMPKGKFLNCMLK